jgi:hypothetical protein
MIGQDPVFGGMQHPSWQVNYAKRLLTLNNISLKAFWVLGCTGFLKGVTRRKNVH